MTELTIMDANLSEAELKEWVFEITEEKAEVFSDAMLWAGALSVSVEDAHADLDTEQALFGEPGMTPEVSAWVLNRVIVALPVQTDNQTFLAEATALFGEPLPDFTIRKVPQLDWVRLTQSQFPPISVSPRLWIVPTWHTGAANIPKGDDTIAITLDPGLAFGTGSHPTTFLCLQWLDTYAELAVRCKSVLDYGCGSGILAIAAAKLGAKQEAMFGVDLDPQAVISSTQNAEMNQVVGLQFGLPDSLVSNQTFDLVVANILTNPLKILAPLLCGHVKTGGRLVLSGILARQAQEVIDTYAPMIDLSVWKTQDGWVCLHGEKRMA